MSFTFNIASAQYPSVPADVQRSANEAKSKSDAHSDEMFAKAKERLEADAKAGKPYLPGAAKPEDLPQAEIPAFPGAEGGGMYSFGGRGGKVYVVTRLEDSGPGTFREALEAAGPRIVVFNVAGIINLKHRIRVRSPYITINGATAPGDGVCIAGDTVELETHDVVIRHMRFRRGATGVGDRNDSIGGNPVGNIMIDHVSASWGLDENMSMYRHMYDHDNDPQTPSKKLPTVNISIQNSIFSECLNTYNHAFGATIGGHNSTFIRNLFANNVARNPSIGMDGDFALINNVIFNWRHRSVDGGDHMSRYQIIHNYFKPGPVTPKDQPVGYRILKPEARRGKNVPKDFGKAYVAGNVVVGNEKVTKDNWAGGVQIDRDELPGSEQEIDQVLKNIRVEEPFPMAPVTIMPAEKAYEYVLANAGATLPKRDPVDQRIVEEVRTGKVTYEEGKGIITDIEQVGGYPEYNGKPYADADSDGMPDDWEKKVGLNPNDASDASKDLNGDGYTNIETYINGLDPSKKVNWKDLENNADPRAVTPPASSASAGR
ncbi:MAG TPA: hypothetical protein VGR35_04445 [Tepidisphaeraceae bacterium]|nr:hypothetical protein [Tepidisphaeraceae bacterium]